MFVTLFLGWLNLTSLELSFASGGHTPPTLRRDQRAYSVEQEAGPALGLAQGLEFPLNRMQLEAHDLLAVYTDGVDEAFNEAGEQFGIDAFNEVLERSAGFSLAALGQVVFDTIDSYAGETPQSDDITVLLLQPGPAGSGGNSIRLPAEPGSVFILLNWIDSLLSGPVLGPVLCHDVKLLAEEVLTNIIKYGELEEGAEVRVSIEQDENRLALEFRDRGIPFDPLQQAQRSELGSETESAAIGGLGVHLLEALSDEQYYQRSDRENRLRLIKRLQ